MQWCGGWHAAEYEESVEQFIRRNLGAEVFERLIEPFCSGVYAGNPSKLGMQAAFGRVRGLCCFRFSTTIATLTAATAAPQYTCAHCQWSGWQDKPSRQPAAPALSQRQHSHGSGVC